MAVINHSKQAKQLVSSVPADRRPRQRFWRTDWFLGAVLIALLVTVHSTTDFFGLFERRFYDFASTSTHRQPSDQIATLAIDNESVANIGRGRVRCMPS